jgi:hypothetical protein
VCESVNLQEGKMKEEQQDTEEQDEKKKLKK